MTHYPLARKLAARHSQRLVHKPLLVSLLPIIALAGRYR